MTEPAPTTTAARAEVHEDTHGPYVYKDEQGKYVGFEVELAEYLAKELGRTSRMVTGDWDKLPELLGRQGAPNPPPPV